MPTTTTPLIDLGPCPAYKRREAEWYPVGAGGILIVRVWKGNPERSKPHRAAYRVEQDAPGCFLIENVTDPTTHDTYRCVPGRHSCTCKAGMTGHTDCKHIAATAAIMEAGRG